MQNMINDVTITFDDVVEVPELNSIMKNMETAVDRFPARDVFHYSLRTDEKEQKALDNVISVTARYHGTLVGYLRILTDHAYIYYILDIMVDPDWQRQGLGTALLECVLQKCKEGGFIKIFLTSLPGKEGFYERFGFRPGMSPVLTIRGEDYMGNQR